MAPSESYRLYEQLVLAGFSGDRPEGTQRSVPWVAEKGDARVHYYGAYGHPREAVLDTYHGVDVFVGLTDEEFSGRQLECSTLEAIDCGCVPVIALRTCQR